MNRSQLREIANNLKAQVAKSITRLTKRDITPELEARFFLSEHLRLDSAGMVVPSELYVAEGFDPTAPAAIGHTFVEGDCMHPWEHDGDIAWFDLNKDPVSGDIALIKLSRASSVSGDSLMAKIFYRYRVAAAVERAPPQLRSQPHAGARDAGCASALPAAVATLGAAPGCV